MHTLNTKIIAASLGMVVLTSALSHAGDHHEASVSFSSTQLTENIFMLQGKGGNIALLEGEQGLVLIDADYKEMSDALKKEISNHGGVEKLSYLINTHWHGDHSGGNDMLGHHAQILAHENVRTRLLSAQEVKLFGMVTELV
ncbi:MAG: MBL fold metallo-hydrolase [Ketobacter sp.]